MARVMGEPAVLGIDVRLADVDPRVHRQLFVHRHSSFHEFHQVLQAAFGWKDKHRYEFQVGDGAIALPARAHSRALFSDSRETTLGLLDEGAEITYVYDLGDMWIHSIHVRALLGADEVLSGTIPRCVLGGGACPPEDAGGPPGYSRMNEVLADPNHEDYRDLQKWANEFPPIPYRLASINRRLAALARRQ